LDFHYALYSKAGMLIAPVTIDTEHPPADAVFARVPPIDPAPCGHRREADFIIALAWLYPNLQPGTYTMEATYSPRGRATRVEIAPITFSVSSSEGAGGPVH
jgi:hypothetical protein